MYSHLILSYIFTFLDLPSKFKIYDTTTWKHLVTTNLSMSYNYKTQHNFTPLANAIANLNQYRYVFLKFTHQIFFLAFNKKNEVEIKKIIPFMQWKKSHSVFNNYSNKGEKIRKYGGGKKAIRIRYNYHICYRDRIFISHQNIFRVNIHNFVYTRLNDIFKPTTIYHKNEYAFGNLSLTYQYQNWNIPQYIIRYILVLVKYYQEHPTFAKEYLSIEDIKLFQSWSSLYSDQIFEEYFFYSANRKISIFSDKSHHHKDELNPHLYSEWPSETEMVNKFRSFKDNKYLQGINKSVSWKDILIL